MFYLLSLTVGLIVGISLAAAISLIAVIPGGHERPLLQKLKKKVLSLALRIPLLSRYIHHIQSLNDKIRRQNIILDNTPSALLLHHPNGTIEPVSTSASFLTGWTTLEIRSPNGEFLEKIISTGEREKFDRALMVARIGEPHLVRHKLRHRNGMLLDVETRFLPIGSPRQEVQLVLSVSTDITALCRFQEQVERKNQDMRDFTSMISHDLKAPIYTIKGMSEALSEDFGETLRERGGLDLVNFIKDSCSRMEALVKSVVEYSRLSSTMLNVESVPLSDILEQVGKDHRQMILESEASVTFPKNMPTLMSDSTRIYQVFSNLVGNSLKYRSPYRTPVIEIAASQDGPALMVSVKDNGIGVPADKLEEIFRPFKRAHQSGAEGSGIGLACVQKIMEKLGGKVSVASTDGLGSTFTLLFPAAIVCSDHAPPRENA